MDANSCTPDIWLQDENNWLQFLSEEKNWHQIPLLNANALHDLKNSSLVRFRGMVQDMHTPEYYIEKCSIYKTDSHTKVCTKTAKYRDNVSYEENEYINLECPDNVTGERQTFVIISDPALNSWAKEVEYSKHKLIDVIKCNHTTSHHKRNLEDDKEAPMEVDTAIPTSSQNSTEASSSQNTVTEHASKKTCLERSSQQSSSVVSHEHLLNFPIPDRSGKACHVKVYEKSDSLKLNEFYEFIGFLSVDPILLPGVEDEQNSMEIQTLNPPPSLIPRIHCIKYRQIQHYNPLLECGGEMSPDKMKCIYKELLIVLTQILLGDTLAAEYLIYHLISEVYLKKDFFSLGKFSLNLSRIPSLDNVDYSKELYSFIEMMVTKSHYFPMTLENMNTQAFIPKKDYECNRLASGLLQLSANSHLVLDETKLTAGRLNSSGVNGIKALAEVIRTQKLVYDFGFYPLEFDCDIPFLILSEGKSMLPSDCHIVLQPDETCVKTFPEIVEAAKHFLKAELLSDIRKYLTLVRETKYEISDSVQQFVQDEFVKMRQNGPVSGDDLHSLLVLSRLICISQGKSTLDEECWKRAQSLEKQRKDRLINK